MQNYRGITLFSAPGKVFAHLLLACIKLTLLSHRQLQQTRWDALLVTASQLCATLFSDVKRTDTQHIDLRMAFDSISRPALWLLLKRASVPEKIITLFRALYDKLVSCIRANSLQSTWFEIMSGVRQGCVMSPDY